MSTQNGAYVIMMQTNSLCKFNYLDAHSRTICSFVEYYFIQLVQIFVAKLIRNLINKWDYFVIYFFNFSLGSPPLVHLSAP